MNSLLVATTSVAGENEVHLLGATPRGLRQEWLGTYERQPDGVDGCTPAYKRKGPKADKDEKFLWFHKQSTSWFVGRRRALCRGAGLISVLDPTKGAAAPEAVAATWKVWASEKAGWLSAPMLRCIPGSEARAELKKQNANAAQTVVLLGNTPHGVRHEFLGSYERWQEKKIHGRPAYVKVGDQRKMMWYSQNSVSWWVGPKSGLGKPTGVLRAKEVRAHAIPG